MGIVDADKLKEYFLQHEIPLDECVLKADGCVIIDLDLKTYDFMFDAMHSVVYDPSSGVADYSSRLSSAFVQFILQCMLFYLSHFNSDDHVIREIHWKLTFDEDKSGYVRMKAWKRRERSKDGYETWTLENGITCSELSVFDPDPLAWISIANVNAQKLLHTREYVSAVFKLLIPRVISYLSDALIRLLQPESSIEDQYLFRIFSSGLRHVSFYGFQGTRSDLLLDESSAVWSLHTRTLDASEYHCGEADLFLYNSPQDFIDAQSRYTIIYDSKDSDAFVILLNADRAIYTFPHGFYYNSGPIKKLKFLEMYQFDEQTVRTRVTTRNQFFWVDMVHCREHFVPLNIREGDVFFEYEHEFYNRKTKQHETEWKSTNIRKTCPWPMLQTYLRAVFSVAAMFRGTDFCRSFIAYSGWKANVSRLIDSRLSWENVEHRLPHKGEEPDAEATYGERIAFLITYWKIPNVSMIISSLPAHLVLK